MKQYNARPDVNAKLAEYMKQYMARPEVKAKKAEYEARPEVKAKKAEFMKQYDERPEVKAKRAEQMKQYNQQYKDAAEHETSKLRGAYFRAYWAELCKATIKLEDLGPVALPMPCPT